MNPIDLQIDTPYWALPLLQPSRNKAVHGGRASGKSHFFAELTIEEHVNDPNLSTVCIREIQKSLKFSMKRLLEQKIEKLGVTNYFDIQDRQIKSKKGKGIIIFEGMQNHTKESIKSLEGFDRLLAEEANSLSAGSLKLLRPTIRKPGSELRFIWNPELPTDPIDALLRGDDPPPDSIVIEANYMDNPWFWETELVADMEYDKRRDPDTYEHVWLGGYVKNNSSRVFRNWTVEEFEAPAEAIFRLGGDWGFSVDPTVAVRCFIIGRKLYIDYEAYQVGCEIMDTPDLFMSIPDAEKWPFVADSARPETISHCKKHGFPKMMPAVKGKGSLKEGVEWLKTYDIVVHPRCKHTIDELTMYSYKTDPVTGDVLPVLKDEKNHVIDAVRYACESFRRAKQGKQVTANPVPTANKWGKRA